MESVKGSFANVFMWGRIASMRGFWICGFHASGLLRGGDEGKGS